MLSFFDKVDFKNLSTVDICLLQCFVVLLLVISDESVFIFITQKLRPLFINKEYLFRQNVAAKVVLDVVLDGSEK